MEQQSTERAYRLSQQEQPEQLEQQYRVSGRLPRLSGAGRQCTVWSQTRTEAGDLFFGRWLYNHAERRRDLFLADP